MLRYPSWASLAANLHGSCHYCLVHQMSQTSGVRRQEGLGQAGSLDMVRRREGRRHISIWVIYDGHGSCHSTSSMKNIRNNMRDRSRGIEHNTIQWREL